MGDYSVVKELAGMPYTYVLSHVLQLSHEGVTSAKFTRRNNRRGGRWQRVGGRRLEEQGTKPGQDDPVLWRYLYHGAKGSAAADKAC